MIKNINKLTTKRKAGKITGKSVNNVISDGVINSVCTACSGSGRYCEYPCSACEGTGKETDL
tara:strand:- start:985 stop:1170 length:186 start_codon:yes stop_codon:yes gene_type:complete